MEYDEHWINDLMKCVLHTLGAPEFIGKMVPASIFRTLDRAERGKSLAVMREFVSTMDGAQIQKT